MSSASMPRNAPDASESSEFELVLGNKQLLSVFFIVVVLLGVFFTMGYLVGRNSAPVGAARQDVYERGDAPSSMPVAKQQAPASVAIDEQPSGSSETAGSEAISSSAQEPAPASANAIDTSANEPQTGRSYLQVVAVAKPEADVLAEVLGKKGFRVLVSPVPNDKLHRVLVGPATDIDHLSRLKAELEAAGFKPFVKRF